jgi:hypothetical protein
MMKAPKTLFQIRPNNFGREKNRNRCMWMLASRTLCYLVLLNSSQNKYPYLLDNELLLASPELKVQPIMQNAPVQHSSSAGSSN